MQILQKIIIKSKESDSFPIHFLAHEQLQHTHTFLSSDTMSSTCTLLKYLLCEIMSLIRRRFIVTGAEEHTNSLLHWWKEEKETMTVILQYLNIYYLSTHSVGRSTYCTQQIVPCISTWTTEGGKDESTNGGKGQSQLMAGVSSVRSWAEHWARLDFENKNVKMAGNLVANTDAVTHQVEEGNEL